MKKVKINLLAIIGMMVAVGTLAFTTPKEKRSVSDQSAVLESWFFTGDELDEATKENMYSSSPTETCDDIDELPCEIQFDPANYQIPTTNTPLQNYLDSHPDGESVKDDAVSVRSL